MKPVLEKQLVFLNSSDFQFDLGTLLAGLEEPSGKEDPKHFCLGWLIGQREKHGKLVKLSPACESCLPQNPIQEIVNMIQPPRPRVSE